jgi:hypothetical protein
VLVVKNKAERLEARQGVMREYILELTGCTLVIYDVRLQEGSCYGNFNWGIEDEDGGNNRRHRA